ncbi:MAG: hypothetical protein LBM96_02780 [Methanobrevibacter sp.]|jgi:hypothetical protein|nr:hypothetical protein [Candidatus Methanoflexus mossambicus]
MKKSKIRLFRNASTTISILGILLIIATIIIVAYLGITLIASEITHDVSSSSQYDTLAKLNSQYNELAKKMNGTANINYENKTLYSNAELELRNAQIAIDDVDSGLSSNKPSTEIDNRIKIAQNQLSVASEEINKL